jgi:transcription elongation factor Elf1
MIQPGDTWHHGAAGELRTVIARPLRSAKCQCGKCGRAWPATVDLRARTYALECPFCGQHTGLELDEAGE